MSIILYGSKATSDMTTSSGISFLMVLVALFDKLSGFHASAQSSVFNDCSVYGKRQIAGIPDQKPQKQRLKSVNASSFNARH